MTGLAVQCGLRKMNLSELQLVTRLADASLKRKQLEFVTTHLFHAGMYARTITLPAGTVLTGVLIKIPTAVIVSGDVKVFIGGDVIRLVGHNVIPASAGRKQAYFTNTETSITMIFATNAKTVEEAEIEFTDDFKSLMSRSLGNDVVVTGE